MRIILTIELDESGMWTVTVTPNVRHVFYDFDAVMEAVKIFFDEAKRREAVSARKKSERNFKGSEKGEVCERGD